MKLLKLVAVVLLVFVSQPQSAVSAPQSPLLSTDPFEPISPTSQEQCNALGREWDERIKFLGNQDNACVQRVGADCLRNQLQDSRAAGECLMRESNPAFARGENVSPYFSCEQGHRSFLAALDNKTAAVKRCRDRVSAASKAIPVIPPSTSSGSNSVYRPAPPASLGVPSTAAPPAQNPGPRPYVLPGSLTGNAVNGGVPDNFNVDAEIAKACAGVATPAACVNYVRSLVGNFEGDGTTALAGRSGADAVTPPLPTFGAGGRGAPNAALPNGFQMPTFGQGGPAALNIPGLPPEAAAALADALATLDGSRSPAPSRGATSLNPNPEFSNAVNAPLAPPTRGRPIAIQHPVTPIPQFEECTCWAAASMMLLGRYPMASNGQRTPCGGLRVDDATIQSFANNNGLQLFMGQSWTVDGLADLLRSGPISIMGQFANLHAVVVSGISGDGTPGGTILTIIDPWPVGRGSTYSMTYEQLMRDYPMSTNHIVRPRR